MNYADEIAPDDHVFTSRGQTVLASDRSWPFLRGTLIEFVRKGLNMVWSFENPNVKAECGCGESFNLQFFGD